ESSLRSEPEGRPRRPKNKTLNHGDTERTEIHGERHLVTTRTGFRKRHAPAFWNALRLRKVAVVAGSCCAPSAIKLSLRHPDRCSPMVFLFPIIFAPRPEGERQPQPGRAVKLRGSPS